MSFADDKFNDELDAELRTLFDDDRLDLRPRPGAGTSIVAGARRVRRRRAALTGGGVSAVVVAMVGGAVLLNNPPPPQQAAAPPAAAGTSLAINPPSPPVPAVSVPASAEPPLSAPAVEDEPRLDSSPTVSSAPVTVGPPTDATSFQAAVAPVLGPDGYGNLTLGMSFSDAVATGSLRAEEDSPPPAEGCGTYQLSEGDGAVRKVVVSGEQGIVTFSASGARTPEGIGSGSSTGEVEQAYPDVQRGSATYSAPTGSGGNYVFYVADDQVDSVQLIAPEVSC